MLKDSKTEYTIGVDVGGTKMCAVLLAGDRVVADYTLQTPKDDLEKFRTMLAALIAPLQERIVKDKAKLKGLGIGLPGVIDRKLGKVLVAPNLVKLNNANIVELGQRVVGADVPVVIDNDAACFTRAEAQLGAGQKYSSVYGVVVGTGIGGSWYMNGAVYMGGFGGTGEPGMMAIDFKQNITLEEAYHKLTQNNPAILAEEAYQGDALAEAVFGEFGQMLGAALANIVNLIEPQVIVVGGGAVQSADLFLPAAKKEIKSKILSPMAAKEVKLVKSKLGKLAGAIGAALLVK
ncbi:MAG: ROK family protein [Candidatus Falkowbacteria bacterium]